MNNDENIERLISEFSARQCDIYIDRQERLTKLVDEHGFETVAKAAGYSLGTLLQYLRATTPKSIGEDSVAQAEFVLKQI